MDYSELCLLNAEQTVQIYYTELCLLNAEL